MQELMTHNYLQVLGILETEYLRRLINYTLACIEKGVRDITKKFQTHRVITSVRRFCALAEPIGPGREAAKKYGLQ